LLLLLLHRGLARRKTGIFDQVIAPPFSGREYLAIYRCIAPWAAS
jgi:hypothetical protein